MLPTVCPGVCIISIPEKWETFSEKIISTGHD
jgi:hypothetical protein